MKTFEENLKSIPTAEKTVLLRLYNQRDELVSIIPNIPGRQGSVRVFKHISEKKGVIDFEAAKEGFLRKKLRMRVKIQASTRNLNCF